jgi:formyl-CoA transferase
MDSQPDSLLDIKVLDLSRVLAGPFCSMLLADMGAEIIKLEIPGKGDDSREFPPFKNGESLYYVNLNRGKKSITLNLKSPKGKRIFLDLVKKVDVLLENFRPGTMERLGLSYDELRKINPRLIYASISGFGQTGPYRERPGYDIIGQAMGGLLSITGWADSPPTRSGTAIGDILSALFTCIGILSALKVREKTHQGQHIDVSLVDSVYAALENIPQKYFVENIVPTRIGNRYEFVYPYDTFKTNDGWVVIGIANDSIWERFIQATGLHELGKNTDYENNTKRVQKHIELKKEIEKWTLSKKKNEIVHLLNKNRVPCCPIYNIQEASEDDHISKARKMVLELRQPRLGKVKIQGNPIKMSETDPTPRGPAPSLGDDTFTVLKELLEVTTQEYNKLKKSGVV